MTTRKQNASAEIISQSFQSQTVFNRFEWNLVCCWDLLMWWTSLSLYLLHSVFKGGKPTYVISLRKKLTLACIPTLTDRFFQIWYGDRDYSAQHFDCSFDDLDIHSRSQVYEKSKIWVSIWVTCGSMLIDVIRSSGQLYCIAKTSMSETARKHFVQFLFMWAMVTGTIKLCRCVQTKGHKTGGEQRTLTQFSTDQRKI